MRCMAQRQLQTVLALRSCQRGSETIRGNFSGAAGPLTPEGAASTVQRDGTAHPWPPAGAEPSSQPSSSSAVSAHGPSLSSEAPESKGPPLLHPAACGDLVLYCLGGPAPQTDSVARSSPTSLCQGSEVWPRAAPTVKLGTSWGLQGYPCLCSVPGTESRHSYVS